MKAKPNLQNWISERTAELARVNAATEDERRRDMEESLNNLRDTLAAALGEAYALLDRPQFVVIDERPALRFRFDGLLAGIRRDDSADRWGQWWELFIERPAELGGGGAFELLGPEGITADALLKLPALAAEARAPEKPSVRPPNTSRWLARWWAAVREGNVPESSDLEFAAVVALAEIAQVLDVIASGMPMAGRGN